MYQEASSLDQRISDLQGQLDRLTVSLQLWRDQQDHLKPAEDRLADLTRQCADIITQWSSAGERQARAVGELEERVSAFSAAEDRLHRDAGERLRALERAIEQEWSELRKIHEEPVRELREQADTLARISAAATTTSVSGFDRAEARLAEIETAINQRLNGVSEQIAAAVAEIRALAPAHTAPQVPAWPIDGVVRLHNQLREASESAESGPIVLPAHTQALSAPAAAPDVFARLESLEQKLSDRERRSAVTAGERQRTTRTLQIVAGATIAVLLIAGGGLWMLQRQASVAATRASDAEQKAQVAIATANQQLAAVRDASEKQLEEARQGAARAEIVSAVLAAPDLVRFAIVGAGPNGISGQVLWSRTRGVVFSGTRIPAAPAKMAYQLWLLTEGLPANAGTFVPDASGRVTYTADAPAVPRAVVGAALTLEPEGGSRVPSQMLVQNRVVRPPVQDPPASAP